MKTKIRFALILAFVIGAAIVIIEANTHRPRLLILHSHGSETAQALTINRGLRDELRNKTHFSVRWYYTGLNALPSRPLAEAQALRARKLVDTWKPDVILAIGDEVQEYVTRHYADDPRIKIVFCAVHEDVEPYGLDFAANATGTLMVPPLDALRELLSNLGRQLGLSKPLRALHIGDKTDDVIDDGAHMSRGNWGDIRFVGNEFVGTFEDWQLTVARAASRADVILTSDYSELYRSANDPTLVPAREVVAWTLAHSPVPVIGTRSQFVWDGGMLAVGASLYQQGREATHMAIRLLEKPESIKYVPPTQLGEFVVAANESRLKERNITLPDIYRALARASNNYFP